MPNGRVVQEVSQVASNVVCTVQKNAWMDEPTFLYWTDSIWNQFSLSNQPKYLLMDSCAVHETAAIKEAPGNHGTKVLYTPRGFTSRLQVLDVGVNKPLKQYMRQQFETFVLSNGQKIERLHIIRWVIGSTERITKETITNTWRSIGYCT